MMKENKIDPDSEHLHVVDMNQTAGLRRISNRFLFHHHSIPESSGIGIVTPDGVIVYATDFTFDQNIGTFYSTEFHKLAQFREKGVLALLCESSGAATIGHSTSDYKLINAIRNTLCESGRSNHCGDVFHGNRPHSTNHR
jgi:ribonuclease J